MSQSIEPAASPHAGLAELYFHDPDSLDRFWESLKPDGMEERIDLAGGEILRGTTEMICIP